MPPAASLAIARAVASGQLVGKNGEPLKHGGKKHGGTGQAKAGKSDGKPAAAAGKGKVAGNGGGKKK